MMQKNTCGTVIGMGLTNQNPYTLSSHLVETVMQRNDSCGKYGTQHGFVNRQIQLCYTGPDCASIWHGDSGGPLVYKDDESMCLIGISAIHNEERCDRPDFPSVFILARVFKNWISRQENLCRR